MILLNFCSKYITLEKNRYIIQIEFDLKFLWVKGIATFYLVD